MSSPGLARSSATNVAVPTVCSNVALHWTVTSQLGDHLLCVHPINFLNQFVHHGLVMDYLSYINDLALLQIVEYQSQVFDFRVLLLNLYLISWLNIDVL